MKKLIGALILAAVIILLWQSFQSDKNAGQNQLNVLATNFDGATTDFSSEENVSAINGLVLEKSGKATIAFPEDYTINASGADFDRNVVLESRFVSVNSTALSRAFNHSARITLRNASENDTICYSPNFYKKSPETGNCVPCETRCSNIQLSNQTLSFTVEKFSTYYLEPTKGELAGTSQTSPLDKNPIYLEKISDIVDVVKRVKPKIVVIAGKHEPTEPSAELVKTLINGKPLYDYFQPSEILFAIVPETKRPTGTYAAYFNSINQQIQQSNNPEYTALRNGLQMLFEDTAFSDTAAKLAQQSRNLQLDLLDENFFENYLTEKHVANAKEAVELLRDIDKRYNMPQQDFAFNSQIAENGAIPIVLHFSWPSGNSQIDAQLLGSDSIITNYNLTSTEYREIALAREDIDALREVPEVNEGITLEEPMESHFTLPSPQSNAVKGAVLRLLSGDTQREANLQLGTQYLKHIDENYKTQLLINRAPNLLAFLKSLLEKVKEKPFDRLITKTTGSPTSSKIVYTRVLVEPKNQNTKLTSLNLPTTINCADATGKSSTKLLNEYFQLSVVKKSANECSIYNGRNPPFFELQIEKLKEIPFKSCIVVFQAGFIQLEPFKTGVSEFAFRLYREEYEAPNTLNPPNSLEETVAKIKTLKTIPKIIITYGKHEPREPTTEIFEGNFLDETNGLQDYYSEDVLFIKIPESETPQGYYLKIDEKINELKRTKAFSQSVLEKLSGNAQFTLSEAREIYEKVNPTIPMSESEFANAIDKTYTGCDKPLHISIHYASGTKPKIYVLNNFHSKNAALFAELQKTGAEIKVDAPELLEINTLSKIIKKKQTSATLNQEEQAFFNELFGPLNSLAAQLLPRYQQRMIDQTLDKKQSIVLELPYNKIQPTQLEDGSIEGSEIWTNVFNNAPAFENSFALRAESYLKTVSEKDAKELTAQNAPSVKKIIDSVLKTNLENN